MVDRSGLEGRGERGEEGGRAQPDFFSTKFFDMFFCGFSKMGRVGGLSSQVKSSQFSTHSWFNESRMI